MSMRWLVNTGKMVMILKLGAHFSSLKKVDCFLFVLFVELLPLRK